MKIREKFKKLNHVIKLLTFLKPQNEKHQYIHIQCIYVCQPELHRNKDIQIDTILSVVLPDVTLDV